MHASLKLIPGVDQRKTLALNEAAISDSDLIRFVPDRNGIGLIQKLGGWTKFFANTIGSTIRALWAWEDTNANTWLGVGAQSSLSVISDGSQQTITPQYIVDDVAVALTTTVGSNVVRITDTGSNIDDYDAVQIRTHISVGGLVLFGVYQCYAVSADTYDIYATDALGDPAYATAAVTTGGAVAKFDTTSGSNVVTVTLEDHGLSVGSTFSILSTTTPTTVGGITFEGNYVVHTVVDADSFTIRGNIIASATANGDENGGDAEYLYWNGIGPLAQGTGYGVGGYGRGGYGTGIPPSPTAPGTPVTTTDWCLDNWGEIFLACPKDGPIFTWAPNGGVPVATIIPNAPTINAGMFVAMPERQIIALGSTFTGIGDPLLIRWCDVNNLNQWIGLTTNQAGSFRLPRGSRIIQGIQGPQQGLIWTDLGLWAMQYIGPPFIYGFNEIGTGCGLIGRKAAASMNGTVYWMGQSQFFRLTGSGVEPIMCPVWDVIFQNIDMDNVDRIRAAPNSRFGEMTWYYPTANGTGEVDAYVKYNILLEQWDFGTLARTAWINESVLGPPIGAGTDTYIYQHEMTNDADGTAMLPSFQTGYFALTEADVKMFVDQIWPDMKWGYYDGTNNASVQLTFYVADYPGDTPIAYGPYTMLASTKFITPRIRGRLVSIKVESSDIGSWWRIGNIRYRLQVDGKY